MKGWTGVGLAAGIAAGFLLSGGANLSFAQMKGDPIEQRVELMKNNSKANKAVAPLAKGQDVDPKAAAVVAKQIKADIGKFVLLFPTGTSSDDMTGKTRAKPEIWAKNEEFRKAGAELASAAGKLETAAMSGDKDAMRMAATDMGKACAACHKQFRGPALKN